MKIRRASLKNIHLIWDKEFLRSFKAKKFIVVEKIGIGICNPNITHITIKR